MSANAITKPDGISWEEWCGQLVDANRVMSRGIDLSDQQYKQITQHVEDLQATNKSLTAQLEASKISNTGLAMQINNAGKADREEVMRLRGLLQENEIPIGG